MTMAAAIRSTSSAVVQGLFPYVNFADMYADQNETDEFARKLYGPNYPRLQQLKAKYDPDQVFNRWFNIKPAA
jgi:FAD/FMN-containing dehydrogenase